MHTVLIIMHTTQVPDLIGNFGFDFIQLISDKNFENINNNIIILKVNNSINSNSINQAKHEPHDDFCLIFVSYDIVKQYHTSKNITSTIISQKAWAQI